MSKESLTQERLQEAVSYDPETGVFTWRVRPLSAFRDARTQKIWNTKYAGKRAGVRDPYGYMRIGLDQTRYPAHRLAWFHTHGRWPFEHIDHINGVRDDNRLGNLREVTRSVNQQNQKRGQRNSTSRYLGVSWSPERRKWVAQIRLNSAVTPLGRYSTEEEAHAAYIAAKEKMHEGYVPASDQPQVPPDRLPPVPVAATMQGSCCG